MLLKTEIFDQIFRSGLYQISINKNIPIVFRGSYKIKSFGDIISDIDLAQFIYASPSLISRISQIIEYRKDFIFTRLHCGTYSEFKLPWEIDNKGSCDFNLIKARQWYTDIKSKNIMDEKNLSFIHNILFESDITIKNLLEIKQVTRPFSEILWDKEDIKKGYKVVRGEKYVLVDLMKKGHVTVIRYLYKFKNEYVSIDFGLVDKTYIKQPSILHEYYRGDLYKIFKSYKWYIKEEYFSQYLQVMKELEKYTGLLNRIRLISNSVKYKILKEDEINYLITDASMYAKKMGIYYIIDRTKKTEKKLTEKIFYIVEKNRKYFRDRVKDKFKKELILYEQRSKEAEIPVSQKLLLEQRGTCPFFPENIKDFNYLLELAERTLIKPEDILRCVSTVSKMYDMDISLFINTVFKKSDLYLKEIGNEIWLCKTYEKIEKVSVDNIKKLQIKILI